MWELSGRCRGGLRGPLVRSSPSQRSGSEDLLGGEQRTKIDRGTSQGDWYHGQRLYRSKVLQGERTWDTIRSVNTYSLGKFRSLVLDVDQIT